MKNKNSGVYEIRNTVTGQRYIGQSSNLKKRWGNHRSALKHRGHENWSLQRDWLKYGPAAFVFAILITAPVLMPDNAIAPVAEVSQSFDDAPTEYWAHDEIQMIYSYGITVGCSYDPPLHCPDRPMTRAEVAVMLARILAILENR